MSLGPLMVDRRHRNDAEDLEVLGHPLVGSVILFARNYSHPAQLAALTARSSAVRSPALLIAVDHEGGRVQRFRDGFTRCLPCAGSDILLSGPGDRPTLLARTTAG